MVEKAKEILQNWDYKTALQFLSDTGSNPGLVVLLSKHTGSFFNNKLRSEIQKLINSAEEVALKNVPAVSVQDEIFHHPDIQSVINRRNNLVRKIDTMRGRLGLEEDQEERRKLAADILSCDEKVQRCWDHIHYFEKHGELKPSLANQVFINVKTIRDLVKIHTNYKSYLSKAKSGRISEKKLFHYQEVYDQVEKFMDTEIKLTT